MDRVQSSDLWRYLMGRLPAVIYINRAHGLYHVRDNTLQSIWADDMTESEHDELLRSLGEMFHKADREAFFHMVDRQALENRANEQALHFARQGGTGTQALYPVRRKFKGRGL